MAIGMHGRRASDGLWPRVLALLAVAALLQTTVLTAFAPGGAGWLPAHGHVAPGGLPAHHAHPWDTSDTPSAPAHGITFTPSDALDGAGIAVSLLPGALLALAAPALRSVSTDVPPLPVAHDVFSPVESPPPQD
ncbi:MAG: hypothetical protein AB7G21_00195 [Dehalococcoidia bacterium]